MSAATCESIDHPLAGLSDAACWHHMQQLQDAPGQLLGQRSKHEHPQQGVTAAPISHCLEARCKHRCSLKSLGTCSSAVSMMMMELGKDEFRMQKTLRQPAFMKRHLSHLLEGGLTDDTALRCM